MRKKKISAVVSVVLLVAVLSGTAVYSSMQAEKYKRGLQYGYRRALSDLGNHVGNIETALEKAPYTNTPTEQNGLAAKLMQESGMAKSALSVLPVGDNSLDNVSRFITQVGDFAMSLSKRTSQGEAITADEFKTMQSLGTYSKKLSNDMQTVDIDFSDAETFHDSVKETANDFSNFPSLIYDGPFSSSVMNRKPKFTQGKEQVLQGNAENIAADFLGMKQSQLTHTQDNAGTLPVYNFTAENGNITISVTKAGGLISSMVDSRAVGSSKLGYAEASKKARDFLGSRGIKSMKESYYAIEDNICLINYAYDQDGVLCYPDLIKVGVALDNGKIARFESAGYIMNHHDRNLKAKLTAAQAKEKVSPRLKIIQSRPALIPTDGGSEKLTYEFLCSGINNERVLIYINADTGYEENILIIQQSDHGILTK
ncbi:MAG TPA: germination protein YpeB [Ruminococcaceae bacterium]|jgi:hypothetical protein|nr:germination protein YpeB [Oscillospiraceae bacterium]